jgi:hypothetical protein
MTTGVGIYATIAGYFAHRLIYRKASGRTDGSALTSKENLNLSDVDKRLQDLEEKGEEMLDRLERIETLLRTNDADKFPSESGGPINGNKEKP